MKRVHLLQSLIVATIWGSAYPLQASLIRAMDLAELVASADEIVVANVQSVVAAWDPAHRKILTTIELTIEENWKGSGHKRVSLVQPGGTVGEIEMTVFGMPTFLPGEKSLLFLQGSGHRHVVGMAQGKRPLRWDGQGKRWLVDSPDTTDTVQAGPGKKLRHAQLIPPTTLDSLRRQVQALLEEN